MKDSFGRNIDYMRLSITDRCNLRCRYCMPEGAPLVPMQDILTCEEILEVVRAAVPLGITKFRITGGEPLVRKGVSTLIRGICGVPGVTRVSMTTNGILLAPMAEELKEAGLSDLNVSLDTAAPGEFQKITGSDRLEEVLSGIRKALDLSFPVKINCVPQGGVYQNAWHGVLKLAEDLPVDVRFIELMPIGYGKNGVSISNEMILEMLRREYPGMQRDIKPHGSGPAVYWKIPGWKGSIGFISAIHGKFCDRCSRIRLTAQGKLKLCLCYGDAVDLREILRNTPDEKRQEDLCGAIREAILEKPKEHHFGEEGGVTEPKPMAQIGG